MTPHEVVGYITNEMKSITLHKVMALVHMNIANKSEAEKFAFIQALRSWKPSAEEQRVLSGRLRRNPRQTLGLVFDAFEHYPQYAARNLITTVL